MRAYNVLYYWSDLLLRLKNTHYSIYGLFLSAPIAAAYPKAIGIDIAKRSSASPIDNWGFLDPLTCANSQQEKLAPVAQDY